MSTTDEIEVWISNFLVLIVLKAISLSGFSITFKTKIKEKPLTKEQKQDNKSISKLNNFI